MKPSTNFSPRQLVSCLCGAGVLAAAAAGCNTGTSGAASSPNPNASSGIIKSPAKISAAAHAHDEDATHGSMVHTHSTRMRVTSTPATLQAGKSAIIELQIVDNADSSPINDFETVHDKKLHLILASSDLTWFYHLHPEFIGKGKFRVKTIIPYERDLRLYADYKPQGEEGEVAFSDLKVAGKNAVPAAPELVADKMKNGWMTKQTRGLPEGYVEGLAEDYKSVPYQVALMPMPAKLEAGKEAMLHFQMRDASGKPIQKLQPYLGAMGHCVILSADPKVYLHSHPMSAQHKMEGMDSSMETSMNTASGGADVMFHTTFPRAGLYKVWGQFRHNDKIITAPFVVNVAAGKQARSTPGAIASANAQKVLIELPDDYKKGAATVKAGTPVALTFHLKSDAGCGNEIALPAAKWSKTLKVGESATVVYTPAKTGELSFACSMDMYRGSLTVK